MQHWVELPIGIDELFRKTKLYVMTDTMNGYVSDDLGALLRHTGGSQASFYRARNDGVLFRGFQCFIANVNSYVPYANERVKLINAKVNSQPNQ